MGEDIQEGKHLQESLEDTEVFSIGNAQANR